MCKGPAGGKEEPGSDFAHSTAFVIVIPMHHGDLSETTELCDTRAGQKGSRNGGKPDNPWYTLFLALMEVGAPGLVCFVINELGANAM